jgi:hypothetical protein
VLASFGDQRQRDNECAHQKPAWRLAIILE